MCLWAGRDQIFGHHCRKRITLYGSKETTCSPQLPNAPKRNRHQSIPRIHWVLPIFHQKLFSHRLTTISPYEKISNLPLGESRTRSIQQNPYHYVSGPSLMTTWLSKEILSPNGRICIRHGSHTLIGGRHLYPITHQIQETSHSPHCFFFSYLHTNQMKLWHLWKRTTSCDKSPGTLETLSGMD